MQGYTYRTRWTSCLSSLPLSSYPAFQPPLTEEGPSLNGVKWGGLLWPSSRRSDPSRAYRLLHFQPQSLDPAPSSDIAVRGSLSGLTVILSLSQSTYRIAKSRCRMRLKSLRASATRAGNVAAHEKRRMSDPKLILTFIIRCFSCAPP